MEQVAVMIKTELFRTELLNTLVSINLSQTGDIHMIIIN